MNPNSSDLTKQSDVLREQISSSLERAQVQKSTLKRNNSRYTTSNIILSALAALLATTAGIFGNAANWKGVCILAAICSSGAVVTAKMQTAEQLNEASECVGQLKALKVETIPLTYDWEQVSEKYQQILSEFSTIDC
jgi:putative cell wall-binding protein